LYLHRPGLIAGAHERPHDVTARDEQWHEHAPEAAVGTGNEHDHREALLPPRVRCVS
jgi:hypothetical protein